MSIEVQDERVDTLRQIRNRPTPYSRARLEQLRAIAKRFWFTLDDHGDGTVTIHGPRYMQPGHVTDLNLRLDTETAYWRLLSEVCCAMAQLSDIFNYVERPLDVPFSGDKKLLLRTSAFFRKIVRAYVEKPTQQ